MNKITIKINGHLYEAYAEDLCELADKFIKNIDDVIAKKEKEIITNSHKDEMKAEMDEMQGIYFSLLSRIHHPQMSMNI